MLYNVVSLSFSFNAYACVGASSASRNLRAIYGNDIKTKTTELHKITFCIIQIQNSN